MKKHLLYAALFVGALSSCSKDDDRVSTPAGEVNNDLEEIKLAVTGAEAFNVQTRGTGVVGGLAGNNNWNGQTLYVLMTDSGTVNKVASANAGYEYENMPTEILWNVAVKAPANGESGAITGPESTSGVHYYYPIKGNFDFYGYHVDDAVQTPEPTATADEKDLTLDVTIDGSQDLLVAKADWSEDVKVADKEFYPNAGGYKYGAYAARRNVQPTLSFQHLLTQLQFTVENESEDNAITVTSINVTSKNTATMTVAGENFGTIAWNATTAKLAVQQKAATGEEPKVMEALEPVILNVGDPATQIGNLLVAASGEDAPITMYVGEITLQQTLDATLADGSLGTGVVVEQTVPFNIALPATSVHPNFLAGHAYNVKIYVYGLSLIKVTADLTAWEDGGSFEVTPEDQVNTGENATFTPTEDDLEAAWIFESTKLFNTLTGEKSFGVKSDTLLAYLASGYQISSAAITRAASDYTFEKFITENKAGEFEMTYFLDNGFTNKDGKVTIESTITAKNTWSNILEKGYFVEFTKESYNQLPETYREKYGEWEALESAEKSELPWLAVEFSPIKKNQLVVSVKTPAGAEITEFNDINWDMETEVTLMTLCARELGVALTPGKWTVTVNGQSVEIEVPAPTTDEPEVEEENTEVPAE